MNTLNDTQFSLIKEIANRDPAFCAVLHTRLQVELNTALTRASELKEAIGGSIVEPAPAPAVESPRINKAAVLREILAAHPGSAVSELTKYLTERKVDMGNGMLNSYLYNMIDNGEVIKKGKRGHYTYSLKK